MNDFASSILSLLLSFTRSLANSALSLLHGAPDGFVEWIGAHWIGLLVVLILSGLTIDMLVYILRWRPQYVWRDYLHHLFRTKDERMADEEFDAGYDNGVQSFSFMDDPIPDIMESGGDMQLSQAITQYDVQPVESYDSQQSAPVIVRRRRSERHGHRVRILRNLHESSATARSATAVHSRDAFHDAVYPTIQQPDAGNYQNDRTPQ